MRRWIPVLARTHPNFFKTYLAAALMSLGLGVTLVPGIEWYDNPSLHRLFRSWHPTWVWGIAFLCIFVMLTIGAYHIWVYGRVGLALLFLVLTLWTISLDGQRGAGYFFLPYICVTLFAQIGEPPLNPITGDGG